MDVIRDRAIVELNQNQVQVLSTNLQATRDRFEIGDLTRTDVAQSEARLELARSSLATARARLSASEENYAGDRPEARCASPPPPSPLPNSPEDSGELCLPAPGPDAIGSRRAPPGWTSTSPCPTPPTVSAIGSGDNGYLGPKKISLVFAAAARLDRRRRPGTHSIYQAASRRADRQRGVRIPDPERSSRTERLGSQPRAGCKLPASRSDPSNQTASRRTRSRWKRRAEQASAPVPSRRLNADRMLNSQVCWCCRLDAYVAALHCSRCFMRNADLGSTRRSTTPSHYRRLAFDWNSVARPLRPRGDPTGPLEVAGTLRAGPAPQGDSAAHMRYRRHDCVRREPSMKNSRSIKKVIAEDKEARGASRAPQWSMPGTKR